MVAPSGEQFEIEGGGYRAVVTESGGALRVLEHDGRPLVDGFAEDEMAPRRPRPAADAVAQPDPRRRLLLRRARPAARAHRAGAAQRLARAGALGGLDARGAHGNSVSLTYRLMAQTRLPVDARPARRSTTCPRTG